jgi:fatty acid desaturase
MCPENAGSTPDGQVWRSRVPSTVMSSPARRTGNRPTRRQREARAYRLTLTTGGLALATVVTAVLALVTAFSWGIVVLLAVLTAVAGFLLRGSLGA